MNDTLQILEKLNTFYSTAFTQLIAITGAALAVIGVVIPILISWQQGKQFKRDQEALERLAHSRMDSAEASLKEMIRQEQAEAEARIRELVESSRSELQRQLKRTEHALRGASYHIQGLNSLERGDDKPSLFDALKAAQEYALGGDERQLPKVLGNAKISANNLSASDFDDGTINAQYDAMKVSVDRLNGNGRWDSDLEQLEALIREARKKP